MSNISRVTPYIAKDATRCGSFAHKANTIERGRACMRACVTRESLARACGNTTRGELEGVGRRDGGDGRVGDIHWGRESNESAGAH